jgi:spore maturation protein CgeB
MPFVALILKKPDSLVIESSIAHDLSASRRILPGLGIRVLFLNRTWFGSCSRGCASALRRLGCDVLEIDHGAVIPSWRDRGLRALARAVGWRLRREFNELILTTADHFRPDFLLVSKGNFVDPETLRRLRALGIPLYNYFPDRISQTHGQMFEESIGEYDCIFDTKRSWDLGTSKEISVRDYVFLPHGYDPEVHRLWPLTERDVAEYRHDAVVVATHTRMKEELLDHLISLRPHLDLAIWGYLWAEHCRSRRVRPFIRGTAVEGSSYAKAIAAAHVNLAIMGVSPTAKDETSTRTYEIPACGGFMLHERSAELLELFTEGKEVACFTSVKELAEKIDYYIAHQEERAAIAHAGYARCVPAYSYDNRMAELLKWHNQFCNKTSI